MKLVEIHRTSYICPICQDMLVRPHFLIPCLHRLCESCMLDQCPVCRAAVSLTLLDRETDALLREQFADEPYICGVCDKEHDYATAILCQNSKSEEEKLKQEGVVKGEDGYRLSEARVLTHIRASIVHQHETTPSGFPSPVTRDIDLPEITHRHWVGTMRNPASRSEELRQAGYSSEDVLRFSMVDYSRPMDRRALANPYYRDDPEYHELRQNDDRLLFNMPRFSESPSRAYHIDIPRHDAERRPAWTSHPLSERPFVGRIHISDQAYGARQEEEMRAAMDDALAAGWPSDATAAID